MPAIYSQIADELANQYSVGYVSKNPKRDGAWRKIIVRVTRPNDHRARQGGLFRSQRQAMRTPFGRVYIIGAGPGDPGLVTARGVRVLADADVVVYDRAVEGVLRWARPEAERIEAGAPAERETAQDAISMLLAEKAREGHLVARLKWGDPFVFDSGAKEALFLHEQGIPFEVIPGVPAAIGAPAYAGVPVTYPGASDAVVLLRGHEGEIDSTPEVDWSALAQIDGTLVCYAGGRQVPTILQSLLDAGAEDDRPVALIYRGTLPTQQTVTGTLEERARGDRDRRRRRRRAPRHRRSREPARPPALVRRASAVRTAALSEFVPATDNAGSQTSVRPVDGQVEYRVKLMPLSRSAFQVLDVPFLTGGPHDDKAGSTEAVINDTLARRLSPERNAIGKVVELGYDSQKYTIVGVTRDVHLAGLGSIEPLIHTISINSQRGAVLARSTPGLSERMTALAKSVDPSVTVRVTPLSEAVKSSLNDAWMGAAVAGGLGAIALVLAVIGIFGVFSYLIEERQREIGIRLALGATKRQVRTALARACRRPVFLGVAAGLGLSILAGTALRTLLFGLSPIDPVSYVIVLAILLTSAIVATAVPVRRALRVDPAVTLRAE